MAINEFLLKEYMRDDGHHPLSPSGADRWMDCHASLRDTIHIRGGKGSSAAQEGTIAHDYAEKILSTGLNANDYHGYPSDEMAYEVQRYVDYVRQIQQDAEADKIYVEQFVSLDRWIPAGGGTADAIVIDEPNNTLHVIDLKYGKGIIVDPKENRQGMLYALGAMEKVLGSFPWLDKVHIHIVQPRLNAFNYWEISVADLYDFADKVAIAAKACLSTNPAYSPSDKACMWCKVKATCPALHKHTYEVIASDFDDLGEYEGDLIKPQELTDEQLKKVVDNKGLIESWLKAVEAHIFDRLERGGEFKGYKMVHGRSVRKWKDNAEAKLVELFGEDIYVKKMRNMTELEKNIGKSRFNELGLTLKPEGKPVLVPESDKRDPIFIADDFDKF